MITPHPTAALAFHDLRTGGKSSSSFFDRELVGQRVGEWRSEVVYGGALELWDELRERAA